VRIKVKNLGVLKQAEFDLGKLTIIRGENNTGKTYATYATYGFLYFWHDPSSSEPFLFVSREQVALLRRNGVIHINLSDCVKPEKIKEIFNKAGSRYTRNLPQVFAKNEASFEDAAFEIEADFDPAYKGKKLDLHIGPPRRQMLRFLKKADEDILTVSLLQPKDNDYYPPPRLLDTMIGDIIRDLLFEATIPNCFIASAERTGSAMFQKELDFTRNKFLEMLSEKDGDGQKRNLYNVYKTDYPLPVRRNVDFIRELSLLSKQKSPLFRAQDNEKVLEDFFDITGGDYSVSREGQILFVPGRGGRRIKLSMGESSSSVRSLLDLGFYLRHQAKKDDLLMIDEPELNLHPKNQRRLARLLVKLVNIGLKVFITTHSDYILKEFNTLIMLKPQTPHLQEIASEYGYSSDELLTPEDVSIYIAKSDRVRLPDKSKSVKIDTLTRAKIDPVTGIDVPVFDETIEEMNAIQDKILYGDIGEIDSA
jgi:hypothetical protein